MIINPPSQSCPIGQPGRYWRSYSPLPVFLSTVNPAFLASEIERLFGELNVEKSLRTGFLQDGQWVSSLASSGRRRVNLPPHAAQLPSQSSYSYIGMLRNLLYTRPIGKLQTNRCHTPAVPAVMNLSSENSLDGLGGMAIIRPLILKYYASKHYLPLFP